MKANLSWDGKMGFTATGDSGHAIKMDVSAEAGGSDSGVRPLELLLHALGGCSGADVASILRKMQQKVEKFSIELDGTRAEEHPKRITQVHMIFRVAGHDIDPERVRHAVELSLTKYCSVAASLNATITHEVIVE
ncbi:putative redox protein [Hydrogenispora ethanolica]|jgi:putative redox protein|uniref:Putative redox protein n=1 Tax=Hydrogenispora ethanolica TaxID=1082276 RepID=A0A4R1RFH6_HYDET|nr:OsmC family protein [Hydrogenispora ethanolica]TCL64728.1 putative redox protein [Hydrogenispora ethanolica]